MSILFPNILHDHPEFSALFDNHEQIRSEVLSNRSKIHTKDFTRQQEESIRVNKEGFPVTNESYIAASDSDPDAFGWHLAVVSERGSPDPYNEKAIPTLCSLMASFGPKVSVSALNFLSPGGALDWHTDGGYSPLEEMRNMWVIDAPIEEGKSSVLYTRGKDGRSMESKVVTNNELYSFRHSTSHKVENNLSKYRTVLIFDLIL